MEDKIRCCCGNNEIDIRLEKVKKAIRENTNTKGALYPSCMRYSICTDTFLKMYCILFQRN
jgi:hypothetical protein